MSEEQFENGLTAGELAGKMVLITGAARGIGFEESKWFSHARAHVWMMDFGTNTAGEGKDPSVVQEAAKQIRAGLSPASTPRISQSNRIKVVSDSSDVNDITAFKETLGRVDQTNGGLDGAVLNAGIRLERSLIRTSPDEIQKIVQTNLMSQMYQTQVLIKHWIEQSKEGSVVLTLSNNPFFGTAHQSILSAASGALMGFVRSVAQEVRKYSIRINAVLPTARTRQTEALPLFKKISPDALSARHVAKIVGFLISEQSRNISGEVLGVAGPRVYSFQFAEHPGVHIGLNQTSISDEIQTMLG